MRAVILADGKLVIKNIPQPSPGHEEALVKITTAGVCHSDLHLVKENWPAFVRPFPIPMGHEGIGIVEEIGPGARGLYRKTIGLYWVSVVQEEDTGVVLEYCLSGRP